MTLANAHNERLFAAQLMSPERATNMDQGLQWFSTTCWSILRAGTDSGKRDEALDYVCTRYWQPLYRFIQQRGYSDEEARDLTQEFFTALVQNRQYENADPAKGKFRSYLLLLVKHFLIDHDRKGAAQKRGAQYSFVPLEDEALCSAKPAVADLEFDRLWALNILQQTSRDLEGEYERRYSVLKQFEPGAETSLSYEDAAAVLATSLSAAKTLIHRFRKRHGELLRENIRRTLADGDTVEEEIRYLLTVLRS